MAKAISIVGPSGAGKTELICRLLEWFGRRGSRVAVLKHSRRRHPADRGKDTWRFRQAGARVVALAAPGLLQVSRPFPGEPDLSETLARLAPEADLILVEGYKTGPLPKIALLDPAGRGVPFGPPPYSGVIALVGPAPVAAHEGLPVFAAGEVQAIGAFILAHLGLPKSGPEKDPGPARE